MVCFTFLDLWSLSLTEKIEKPKSNKTGAEYGRAFAGGDSNIIISQYYLLTFFSPLQINESVSSRIIGATAVIR